MHRKKNIWTKAKFKEGIPNETYYLTNFKNRIQLFEEEKTGWGSKRPNVSKQVSSWIAKLADNKSEH